MEGLPYRQVLVFSIDNRRKWFKVVSCPTLESLHIVKGAWPWPIRARCRSILGSGPFPDVFRAIIDTPETTSTWLPIPISWKRVHLRSKMSRSRLCQANRYLSAVQASKKRLLQERSGRSLTISGSWTLTVSRHEVLREFCPKSERSRAGSRFALSGRQILAYTAHLDCVHTDLDGSGHPLV
jgi:hypothetical protein